MTRNGGCVWEPTELRALKHELAQMSCSCEVCIQQRELPWYKQVYPQRNQEVQVANAYEFLDQSVQVKFENEDPKQTCRHIQMNNFEDTCPSCLVTMHLLKNLTRFMKDEESETNVEMFTRNKSTEALNIWDSTIKPYLNISNLSLCDMSSLNVSDTTGTDPILDHKHIKKNDTNEAMEIGKNIANDVKMSIYGTCFCLDKLIDTIRPPMQGYIGT